MSNLTIDLFTSSVEDQELSEYRVLAALKKYAEQLHKNLLFPSFSELIETFNMLSTLTNQRGYFRSLRSHNISGVDFENQKLIYRDVDSGNEENNISALFNFISWAMPKIKEVVDEGIAIFDFVESQISVKEIGLMPFYNDEGYLIVPDNKEKEIHVFRFQLSSIFDSDVPFKSLKTTHIESIQEELCLTRPEEIKLELLKKYPELPNPATYNICTELDMPFNETILPVAKRKMMRKLAA